MQHTFDRNEQLESIKELLWEPEVEGMLPGLKMMELMPLDLKDADIECNTWL